MAVPNLRLGRQVDGHAHDIGTPAPLEGHHIGRGWQQRQGTTLRWRGQRRVAVLERDEPALEGGVGLVSPVDGVLLEEGQAP